MARFLFRLPFCLLLCALTSGCDTRSDVACTMPPLCDGDDGATYFATERDEPFVPLPGADFVNPHGDYEVVDGRCRSSGWPSLRTGELTEAEADQLSELGRLGCFERLSGLHEIPRECDGTIQNIEFRGAHATAHNGCGSAEGSPETAREIRKRAADVREFLARRGHPFDGAVWYRLFEETDAESAAARYANPRAWPLGAPATEGTFLVNPPEAATLRALAAEVPASRSAAPRLPRSLADLKPSCACQCAHPAVRVVDRRPAGALAALSPDCPAHDHVPQAKALAPRTARPVPCPQRA